MGKRGPGAHVATARPLHGVANPRRKDRYSGLTRAESVATFVERLTITSGAYAGQPFELRDWQRDAIQNIYGTPPKRTVLLSTARKSGKTGFASALALCALSGPESRRRGQILVAAADRAQGKLTYNEVRAFALADADLAARVTFRDYNGSIEDVVNGSLLTVLSSDAAKAHGMSGSFILADEVSQWKRAPG